MNRINLLKYGFYRTPEKDFSDDGNRFTCYSLTGADRIRVSKSKWQDEIFISATINGDLEYAEYSRLPHYTGLDRLNGVDINNLTDADLEQLAIDCLEYQKEYEAAEKQIVYPTETELLNKLSTIQKLRAGEYAEVVKLIKDNFDTFITLDRYDMHTITDYTKSIKRDADIDIYKTVKDCINKPYSRYIIKNQNDLKPSWYYKSLLEKFKKLTFKGLQ